jgi:ATP-dependent Clp protease ATP-binding subunit ClpC
MYERFTDRARKVMQLANEQAQNFNREYIGTEHILLGLIKEGSGVAAHVLKNLGIDPDRIRVEVKKLSPPGPDFDAPRKLPYIPLAKKVIENAMDEARNLNHNYVGTEHLLMGLLRVTDGAAAQVLMNLGLKLEDVRNEVLNILGHGPSSSPQKSASESPTSQLVVVTSFAREERSRLGHGALEVGHLLLALLRTNDTVLNQALANLGIKPENLRDEVTRLLQSLPPKGTD